MSNALVIPNNEELHSLAKILDDICKKEEWIKRKGLVGIYVFDSTDDILDLVNQYNELNALRSKLNQYV